MNPKIKRIIALAAPLVLLALLLAYLTRPVKTTSGEGTPGEKGVLNLLNFINSSGDEEKPADFDPSRIKTYEIEEEKFIKSVAIEKNPVCAGEDFMVTVALANPNGPLSSLVTRIGNQSGNPAILRFERGGEREFYIVVRDEGKHIEFRKMTINVQECPDKPIVHLQARLHSTLADTAEFEVLEQKGLSGKCVYNWDFGDGIYLKTETGTAQHNYAKREQNQFLSTFTVKVTVTDALNKQAMGRASVSLPNIHYISRMMGSPSIPILYERFPKLKGTTYETKITMKNIFDENISFEEVQAEFKPCDTSSRSDFKNFNASQFISKTFIPGKGIVEDTLSFDRSLMPDLTCIVVIKLIGKMQGDKAVTSTLYLDIPPTTKEGIDPNRDKIITDEDTIRKVKKAQELLGKDRPITPEDIRKLEQEGKL